MKRLLAGLLALSMLFYVAPLSAFAASDNSVSQTVTVDSQQDANLIQAIASDPFLTQTNSAPQEQNATVDTSNVSMEATNSFGKLLLNGMDEENGSTFSSKNRIVDIKMNGSTATVKYIAEEDADLVVGIYADEAEEQMVASGTVAVTKTTDGTATVAITGDIPEYYVIKGYLFDKAEHAPLCEPFRDVSQTKDIVDIGSATVEDFPEDRVINLDEDNKTNFAVVTEGVTLLTTDDVVAGQNTVAQCDNDNLNYTISNASDEIKNLQVGDILTYEYAAGEMLIVKVSTIETSGDTVTIHGDDTLEITDVFDALKIETDSNTREFEFEQEDGFEDLGEVVLDDSIFDEDTGMPMQFGEDESIEESNGPGFDLTKPFEDTKDADIGRNWKVNKTFSAGVTIGGEIAVSAQATLTYYISLGTQSVDFKVQPKAVAQLSVSGQLNETFALPSFGVAPIPGIYIGCKPEFKLNVGVNGTVVATATTTVGAKYTHTLFEKGTFENTSTTPVFKIEANIEGTVYVGIDLAPQISIFGGVVATIKVRAEMGAKATVKVRAELVAGESASHGCKMCYGLTITATINLGVSLEFLCGWVDGASWDFPELSRELGRFYWSPEYNDFGKGDCPHTTPATPDVPEDPVDPNIPTGGTVIDSGTCGEKGDNLSWTLDDNGVLTISGTGKMKDYDRYYTVAPWKKSEYADKIQYVLIKGGVTSIGSHAFSDCNIIVAAISKSVTNIGNSAFSGSGLTSITIPGSVTSIGTDVFSGNNALTNVVISSGVLKISGNMFYNCKSLTSVTIPSSVLSIGSSAFENCSSLTNVAIPSSVTNIGGSAFKNCSSLTSITIPDGVTQIGSDAFRNSGLTSVTIPESVTNMGTGVFYNCDNLKTAVLQKGIQSINRATFYGCNNLTSVTIPDSVTSIGGGDSYDYGAFGNCASLTSIAIPASVKDIGIRAFEGCTSLARVTMPEGVTSIGKSAFNGCSALTSVTIPASVKTIGDSAFSGCTGLVGVTISDGVITIGSSAFSGCSSLTSIVIPASVTTIGSYAFQSCSVLTNAKIAEGVPSIGSSAFENCSSLTNVAIPSSVTNIGGSAFKNCSSLTSITIPDGVTQIGSDAFRNSGLTSVTIPESVTNMGTGVFYNCDNLKTAVLQKGIQSINRATFYGCNNLTSVTIPDSVTSIGGGDSYDYGAFGNCASLTSIAIPASVKDIGIRAFEGCTSLARVTMPEGVTSIGKSAFDGCSALTSVTIPASVKTIGSYAFNNSDVEIHFAGTKEQWKAIALPTGTNDRVLTTTIHCSDGNVEPATENSITTGKTTTDNATLHAVFNGLTAGEDYAVIVSKSAENPLDAGNLIYINQKTAGANGVLDVPFISSESGAAYVVACRKGGSTNPGGNTGKDDSSSTSKPGGDKSDTTKPSTPEQPSPSGGGGGAIVAVVLIGGAAAAVTAGVILMMPVEVSGVAQLNDGNVLANANVQLMKDGQQVAQTTTDESGRFALEVKRGEYQMNVTTVNPETGEQTVRTASVKAPAKNTNFVF